MGLSYRLPYALRAGTGLTALSPHAQRASRVALVPPSHEDEGVYAARRAQGNLPYDSPGTILPIFVPVHSRA